MVNGEDVYSRSVSEFANSLQDNPDKEPGKFDGWHTCATAVKQYDDTTVKNWKEEIDTLLVFVSL